MSIAIGDKEKRHRLRKQGACKIKGCSQRGRYNYGMEVFYHGFCKDHYSQYQEGIIDFLGKKIRPNLQGKKNIDAKYPSRKKGVRWNKKDHVKNNLRCKVVGCEGRGERNRGKYHFFKGFCAYHYREWFLKGFMDKDGNVLISKLEINSPKKSEAFVVTPQMIKRYKKLGLIL